MSNTPIPNSPVVQVIDRDESARDQYQRMVDRLPLRMQFSASADDLSKLRRSREISCVVLDIDIQCDESELRNCLLFQQRAGIPVILTTTDDQSQKAARCLQIGALAILRRPLAINSLEEILRYAVDQRQARSGLQQQYAQLKKEFDKLTFRQRQILKSIIAGHPNKVIAKSLKVSIRTVETERSRIIAAFGADTISAVAHKFGAFGVLQAYNQLQVRESNQKLRIPTTSWHDQPADLEIRPDAHHPLGKPRGSTVVQVDAVENHHDR